MATAVVIQPEDYNGWADFSRDKLGLNTIAWNKGIDENGLSRSETNWKEYQNRPVPQSEHDYWKTTGAFKIGIARMPGVCWHKKPFDPNLRWFEVDIDRQSSVDVVCTKNGRKAPIEGIAKVFLVEGHLDDPGKIHISGYYHSDKPYPHISSGNIVELKCDGSHGIVRGTNSDTKCYKWCI